MRISLLTLIAAATFTLSACNSGSGGGEVHYQSPQPEYNSQLGSGKAYTGDGNFTLEAENRFASLSVDSGNTYHPERNHNEREQCYSYTKHPIILVHGLYGFNDILGVSLTEGLVPGKDNELQVKPEDGKGIDYWYKVAEAIELGGGVAISLTVPKLNSSEHRGEALIDKLDALVKLYEEGELNLNDNICSEGEGFDASKFHLMGHSHGGPTIRYVLQHRPDLLASVTTIGGVNVYGIPETTMQAAYPGHLSGDYTPQTQNDSSTCTAAKKAEEEGKFKPGPLPPECNTMAAFTSQIDSFAYGPAFQGSMNLLAEIIEFVGGNAQNDQSNASASFNSLSAKGIADFNKKHAIGLPKYHELFQYDDDGKEKTLAGLGLRDPCESGYYNSNSNFSNAFGSDVDSCEKSLHGAAYAYYTGDPIVIDRETDDRLYTDIEDIEKISQGYNLAEPDDSGTNVDNNIAGEADKRVFLFSWSGFRHTDMNPLDPTDRLTATTACLLSAWETNPDWIKNNNSETFKKISDSVLQFLGLRSPEDATADPDYEKQFLCKESDILEPSDGMVQQYSSHFGTVLRSDYKLNHLDEINWFLGSHNAEFTPLAIYRIHANRLRQLEELHLQ